MLAAEDLEDVEDDDDITGVIVAFDLDGDGDIEPDEVNPEAVFFDFAETGDTTGIFLPDYDDDKITIEVVDDGDQELDGDDGIIRLTVDQIAGDDDLTLLYKDPASQADNTFQVVAEVETTKGTLSTDMPTVGITDDAVVTLEDPDLNTDPNTVETYDASDLEFIIEYVGGEVVVGTLAITHGDDEVGAGEVDATFIETGPNTGIFVADDIDMGDIDDAVGGLEDGEEINFEYTDLLTDETDDTDDIDITVGIPDAGIDVDRSTVPVPLADLGADGDLDPSAVEVTISVIDPTANTNPGSVETVDIDFETGGITTRDGDGVTSTSNDDGDDAGDDANAAILALTGLDGDITLTETGPNTGIFEEDQPLLPTIIDVDRLIDTRITFEYDDETVSVTYRAFDGTITVNPAVAGPGGIVTVTVVDSDANKDPGEVDELAVECETDEDTEEAGDCPITLEETGDNTGIFTEEVELGVDIDVSDGDDFSTEIIFTYTDDVTSAGDDLEDREATVRIATSTGQLVIAPEVVGPGTEVTLTLIDTDLNGNPNGVDDTDDDFPAAGAGIVELSSSDGDDAEIDFEETGPNTGIFEATIQFEPRDPDVDGAATAGDGSDDVTYSVLPGDVLAFRYEDESGSGGGSTIVSVTIEITSVDPTMEATSPTVQIGGTIALTVEDSDANRDADSLDSVDVEITSDSDPVGFTLSALETAENSGIFTVNVPTSASVTSGAITVRSSDDVFLEYTDEFPADYADRVETTLDPSKDFVLVVPVGTSVSTDTSATTPEPVVPKDISGNELDEVSAGQQVVLSTTVNNNRNTDLAYAAVIEVRDADGFTVLLQWATGTLSAGGENEVGLSWTPMDAGEYTIRTFVLSDISNPSALSLIEESTLTVS